MIGSLGIAQGPAFAASQAKTCEAIFFFNSSSLRELDRSIDRLDQFQVGTVEQTARFWWLSMVETEPGLPVLSASQITELNTKAQVVARLLGSQPKGYDIEWVVLMGGANGWC